MATVDDKRDIFSEIAACRAISEGFPELSINDSFPSLSNKRDPIEFLVNLLKSLVGYEEIRNKIVEIISKKTDTLEDRIKFALKKALKAYVNCNVDPSLPDALQSTGSGYDFRVQSIDFTNTLKINPQSEAGKLFYIDPNSGLNSEDLNTFLYSTIQTGNQENWENILQVTFNETGNPNNTFNVIAHSNYDNRTLTQFNNDLLDSTDLFNTEKLLTKIMDSVFGVVSFEFGFTEEQLKQEERVRDVVDNITSSEDDVVIDDSFFEFSDAEVNEQSRRAKNRSNGIQEIVNCDNAESSVSFDTISEMHDNVSGATPIEQTREIEGKIDRIGQESSMNVSDKDKPTVELNLLDEILRKLHVSILNLLFSPKVILIFAINHRIINGPNASFRDLNDFMTQNKALMEEVIKGIRDEVVQELLSEVLEQINKLIETKARALLTEKINNQKAQLASLFGIPQEIIRQINNLT